MRSSFQNGSGLDIYQLNKVDKVKTDGARGKEWSIVSSEKKKKHQFITVIFPFTKYEERINEDENKPDLKGWEINTSNLKSDAIQTLSKSGKHFLFGVQEIEINNEKIKFSEKVDLFIVIKRENTLIQSLHYKNFKIYKSGNNMKVIIQPLDNFTLN